MLIKIKVDHADDQTPYNEKVELFHICWNEQFYKVLMCPTIKKFLFL